MFTHHQKCNCPFPRKCVLLDHTDECAKQCHCGNALYLLNVLSINSDIIIDRVICAPAWPLKINN